MYIRACLVKWSQKLARIVNNNPKSDVQLITHVRVSWCLFLCFNVKSKGRRTNQQNLATVILDNVKESQRGWISLQQFFPNIRLWPAWGGIIPRAAMARPGSRHSECSNHTTDTDISDNRPRSLKSMMANIWSPAAVSPSVERGKTRRIFVTCSKVNSQIT